MAVFRLITSSNLAGCSTGKSAGLSTGKDLAHQSTAAPGQIVNVRSVGHKPSRSDVKPPRKYRREPVPCRQIYEPLVMQVKHRGCPHRKRIRMGVGHIREGPVEVLRTSGLNNLKPHPQCPRRDFCFLQPGLHGACGVWLEEKGDQTDPRHSLLEQFQALADEFRSESGQPP